MYEPDRMVLVTGYNTEQGCYMSGYDRLHTNGTYCRRSDGLIVKAPPVGKALTCFFQYEGKLRIYHVCDDTLGTNIIDYLESYYETHFTNSSAFAHYVTTGSWVECSPYKANLVLEHNMQFFHPKQKVKVGDVLCIFYAEAKQARSRKSGKLRSVFLKCKKARKRKGNFVRGVGLNKRVYTPDEIRDIYRVLPNTDYHFMVCIGMYEGKPIWLSQAGRQSPREVNVPFVVTVGDYDPYEEEVPVLTFIRHMK